MSKSNQASNQPQVNSHESKFMGLVKKYESTTFAYFTRAFEPMGILIAAVGLLVTLITLNIYRYEIKQNKEQQKYDVNYQLSSALEAARYLDKGKSAIKKRKSNKNVRRCKTGINQLSARVGQIEIFEKAVALDVDLKGISAYEVNLAFPKEVEKFINLKGGNLTYAEFSKSNLYRADFSQAKMNNADLDYACLKMAKFSGTELTEANLRYAVIVKADLSNVVLENSNLYRANLTGANLSLANLTEANLKRAVLKGANLSNAILKNTDFTGADLRRVKNLTQAQLSEACADADELPLIPKNMEWKSTNTNCR